jgi:hypothetical protein
MRVAPHRETRSVRWQAGMGERVCGSLAQVSGQDSQRDLSRPGTLLQKQCWAPKREASRLGTPCQRANG